MASPNDYPARGRVKRIDGDSVVFIPTGTNYELHLNGGEGTFSGPIDKPIDAVIRVTARKIWTVPSGGNFIQPIFGSPRIIQGRVKWLDDRRMVVSAGTNFLVELPPSEEAVALANGAVEVGSMVNVTALPGATLAPQVLAKA
jgi:hypothetical protein